MSSFIVSLLVGVVPTSSVSAPMVEPSVIAQLPEVRRSRPSVGLELTFRGMGLVSWDSSTTIVSSSGVLGGVELGVSWSPWKEGTSFGLVYGALTTEGSLQSAESVRLGVHGARLTMSHAFELTEVFALVGCGAVLLDVGSLSVSLDERDVDLTDTAFGIGARVGAALEARLRLDEDGSARVVISFFGAAQAESGLSFSRVTADVDGSPDPKRIAEVPIDMGSVSLTGATFGIGAGIYF